MIISNTGSDESLLSITNIKWTFKNVGESITVHNANYNVTVKKSNILNISRALAFTKKEISVNLPDGAEPASYADGQIRMQVVTDGNVDTLIIRDGDGNTIDDALIDMYYSDLDEDRRTWTVTLQEDEEDDYTFLLYAQSDGVVAGEPVRISISVDNPANGTPSDPTQPGDPSSDFYSFTDYIRSRWQRITDFIKSIVAFFQRLFN